MSSQYEQIISESIDANGNKVVVFVKQDPNNPEKKIKVTKTIKITKKTVSFNPIVEEQKKWRRFNIISSNYKQASTTINFEPVKEEEESDLAPIVDKIKERMNFKLKSAEFKIVAEPKKIFDADTKRRGFTHYGEETYTLKVQNLSESITEDQLKFLFSNGVCSPYDIRRVFIARHREDNNKSKGFGFVTFRNKSDAETAMDKYNGVPVDDLILCVDWAEER